MCSDYNDLSLVDGSDLAPFIVKACMYGIMGLEND